MTMETGAVPVADDDRWYLLLDPAWTPADDQDPPPIEAVAGAWPVGEDDEAGVFQPNPAYEPSDPDLPTDPIDSVLRELAEGNGEPDHARALLRRSLFFLAMNGDEGPLVMNSPDEKQCVVVATAAPQTTLVTAPSWHCVGLPELVDRLVPGVDVLINPGGVAAVRLDADFVRDGLVDGDEKRESLADGESGPYAALRTLGSRAETTAP